MKIQVEGLGEVRNLLKRLHEQRPRAAAIALTNTAKRLQGDLKTEMTRTFDRPTPYTMAGLRIKSASPDDLWAAVYLKDKSATSKGNAAGDYLMPQIEGGIRAAKRSEQHLRNVGILGPNQCWVPARGGPIDAYGNLRGSELSALLSDLGASPDPLQRSKKGKYFVMTEGGRATGVWKREGKGFRPVLHFTGPQSYRKRFDFYGIGERRGSAYLLEECTNELNALLQRTP